MVQPSLGSSQPIILHGTQVFENRYLAYFNQRSNTHFDVIKKLEREQPQLQAAVETQSKWQRKLQNQTAVVWVDQARPLLIRQDHSSQGLLYSCKSGMGGLGKQEEIIASHKEFEKLSQIQHLKVLLPQKKGGSKLTEDVENIDS